MFKIQTKYNKFTCSRAIDPTNTELRKGAQAVPSIFKWTNKNDNDVVTKSPCSFLLLFPFNILCIPISVDPRPSIPSGIDPNISPKGEIEVEGVSPDSIAAAIRAPVLVLTLPLTLPIPL